MRRHLILVIVVGALVGLTAGTAGAECLELVAEVSQDVPWDSLPWVNAVAVSGDFAYYNGGPVLHVVDVSTPSSPQLMGELTLRDGIKAIAVNGSNAYVAMGAHGISVVDVSDPLAPVERSSIDTSALDVAVSGGYLYVAGGSAGLGVFELGDPAHPVPVGRLTMAMAYATDVAIGHSDECTYAFTATYTALRVVDVSDPGRPVEVGQHTSIGTSDIAVSGGYAFVIDSLDQLRVVDVSSPSTPIRAGEVVDLFPTGVPTSIAVSVSHAYAAGLWGIKAIDVSVPTEPEVGGTSWDFSVEDIVWAGGYVYAAFYDVWSGRAGLAVARACDGEPVDFGSIECDEPQPHITHESFIPAVAVTTGAHGSFFTTDVEISNRGEGDAEVTFEWLPRGLDNATPLVSAGYLLAAGESRHFSNALAEIFGLGPDSTGALRLTSSSDSVIGMSRIYNIPAGEVGTFGQGMPAIPTDNMIASGERRRITFLCDDANERANVGCVNGSDLPVQVSIGIYDAAGTELDIRTMSLGPYANDQINRVLQPWQPVRGYVDVWSDTDDALFYCYGSVLDNLTSDPTTVLPQ